MSYEKTISMNPDMSGMAEIFPDIVFSRQDGEELTMQILSPWWDHEGGEIPRYPLIVFIQGCGWTFPNVWYEIPQLSKFAQEGYVVAAITHRDATQGHPYPACIQDVKTAIRFLRKNADIYGIDADRIGLFGTSSGGNLAILSALYTNETYFDLIPHSETSTLCLLSEKNKIQDMEYPEFSDKIDYIISCFPTTDFVDFYLDPGMDTDIKSVFEALSDGKVDEEYSVLKAMSPCHILNELPKKPSLPPILLAHGTGDLLIPYEHSARLFKILKEIGADVSFVTVEGGPHEGPFWSREMLSLIFEFIHSHC